MCDHYTEDELQEMLKCKPPNLIVVTNRKVTARLYKEIDLKLCNVPVQIETLDVSDSALEVDFRDTLDKVQSRRIDDMLFELDENQKKFEDGNRKKIPMVYSGKRIKHLL